MEAEVGFPPLLDPPLVGLTAGLHPLLFGLHTGAVEFFGVLPFAVAPLLGSLVLDAALRLVCVMLAEPLLIWSLLGGRVRA